MSLRPGWLPPAALAGQFVYPIRIGGTPGRANRPSTPLVVANLLVCGAGVWLPVSPLAPVFGFIPLPAAWRPSSRPMAASRP